MQPPASPDGSDLPYTSFAFSRPQQSPPRPRRNPHAHLIPRTETSCPSHLTGSQRTHWLKAGKKAQRNQHLLQTLPSFDWPQLQHDPPIFIHHLTPIIVLEQILETLRYVDIYVIDTESEAPTRFHSETIPSIIQILAIHTSLSSTILFIETQFLPPRTSPTYFPIQQLCRQIFSSDNYIIAWGNPVDELIPFQQFGLFDVSHITHPINLQQFFTQHWNEHHPHQPSCPAHPRHVTIRPDSDSDSQSEFELICHVNSSDLFMEHAPAATTMSTCECPDSVRPYKRENEQWALQKAVQFALNEALDKRHTHNFWTCGLDLQLHTGLPAQDVSTRADMTSYALNDVLAPTKLLFHLHHPVLKNLPPTSSSTSSSSTLTTIVSTTSSVQDFFFAEPPLQVPVTTESPHDDSSTPDSSTPEIPAEPSSSPSVLPLSTAPSSSAPSTTPFSFIILADSHLKVLHKTITTNNYTAQLFSTSGLKWLDVYESRLCAYTTIQSSTFHSHLVSCSAIMFIIGTNSLRCFSYDQVIQQVTDVINYIRQHHPNLSQKLQIAISLTFPCTKTSSRFQSIATLGYNIRLYNDALHKLSETLNFTILNFNITSENLAPDGMHLAFAVTPVLYNHITSYFDAVVQHLLSTPRLRQRSQAAKQRRNRLRHDKMKSKQQTLFICRSIAPCWKPKHVKHILHQRQIKFARISEVHNHQLKLFFNNANDRDLAEALLPDSVFDERHFASTFEHND